MDEIRLKVPQELLKAEAREMRLQRVVRGEPKMFLVLNTYGGIEVCSRLSHVKGIILATSTSGGLDFNTDLLTPEDKEFFTTAFNTPLE